MRIAIVAPPWVPIPPPAYGGTELVIDGLARGLVAAGHEVLLFTTGDSSCAVPTAWLYDRARGILPPGHEEIERRHVAAAYDAIAGCDLVHDHTLAGPPHGAGASGLPIVATCHGRLDSAAGRAFAALAERVGLIAISHTQARAAGGARLLGVVHHGIELGDFPFGDGGGGYVAFLGRMSPDKGAHRAIEAAAAAGVPILLAGKCSEPVEHAYFDAEVRPRLGPRAAYLGELERKEKLELLSRARCLLNPISWPEPFGLVMIEALACGTPVVASDEGAAPEIVRHGATGLLVGDGVHLPAAVDAAAAIDRRTCRADVEERFTLERMVAGHVEIYRRVLDAWPPMSPGPTPGRR